MESIEIKSKRNIHRKRTLGFSFGSFFSKNKPFGFVLDLKNNLKNLKINLKQTLIVPAGNWVNFLKMAGC